MLCTKSPKSLKNYFLFYYFIYLFIQLTNKDSYLPSAPPSAASGYCHALYKILYIIYFVTKQNKLGSSTEVIIPFLCNYYNHT